jgi:hypothetical protein
MHEDPNHSLLGLLYHRHYNEYSHKEKYKCQLNFLPLQVIYTIPNRENQDLVKEFYEFMKNYNTFEKYQNNNLKAIIAIAKFLDLFLSFFIQLLKESKLSNSSCKIKGRASDPDKDG